MSQIYTNHTVSQAASNLNHASARFVHSVDAAVENVLDRFLTWQRRHKDRMHLLSLDDRMLRDIGVSLADVDRETSKPFWRS
ncbi:MAG TPA: DUF1127 domain-containing protein [Candidatus Udaeobacter sp.]|nr:DUF1127 domain-containing protein [Candidatus Udaeobacter sp.]